MCAYFQTGFQMRPAGRVRGGRPDAQAVPHFPGAEKGYAEPAFSADGTRLVFSRYSPLAISAIWIARADGSEARQLTSEGSSPSWCAADAQIAFLRNGRVMVMKADGTGVFELRVPNTALATDVACSPR